MFNIFGNSNRGCNDSCDSGGDSCCCIIIILLLIFCFCGGGSFGGGSSCGCRNSGSSNKCC